MQAPQLSDTNVTDYSVLPAPELLCREIARPEPQASFIAQAREEIHRIIFGDDRRLLVVIGPCSIHDTKAGLEYAQLLSKLAEKVQDRMKLVMRVYFEKPRTTVGWKGLIMDPDLDGTANIHDGLRVARQFLLDVLNLGMPTSTEFLDPITPQYIADLVCWAAIGARTTESQTHRQMASGLSMPLGFKNGTSGDVKVAINAIKAASQPQTFLGISHQGLASAVSTRGNPHCHLILRGGDHGPNYEASYVADAAEHLRKAGLTPAVMVDCSHGNSNKDHRRQPEVLRNVLEQSLQGDSAVIGAMIESNLLDGNQPFPQPLDQLIYGRSITDACIDWQTTERMIEEAYEALAPRFAVGV
ncbi:MAG: 3-deoxy-7-phosphoheptulonate synthase [Verrucomicrobiota bacterium JB022]|nr:3-deoxy-7-phosphoheptulonate synthase [Verrucomicrobiota bacterium JB022]